MDQQKDLSFEQLKKLNRSLDEQLRQLDKQPNASRDFSWKKLLLKIALVSLGLVLPFIILIRASVFVYTNYQLNGWLSLTLGCAATVVLLMLYALFAAYRFGIHRKVQKYILRGLLVLVVAYTLYGVMYFSSLNTKTEQIKSYYRSLHPIMRVALTTITLTNDNLVVTDIQRKPEDYHKMGLPKNEQSLHYLQSTGYVHAVDLRTRGRAEWKNWILKSSFNLVGLSTIRHRGTADHLHVYLPLNR